MAKKVEVTQEEREAVDRIAFGLFMEWVDECGKEDSKEEQTAIKDFAYTMGISEKSRFAMIFAGFRAGLGKGVELCERMEKVGGRK